MTAENYSNDPAASGSLNAASFMTLRDYANANHCSYENVRILVEKYGEQLKGHIIEGKPRLLDNHAVEFLNNVRIANRKSPDATVVMPLSRNSGVPAAVSDPKTKAALALISKSFEDINSSLSRISSSSDKLTEQQELMNAGLDSLSFSVNQILDLSRQSASQEAASAASFASILDRKDEELKQKDDQIRKFEDEIEQLKKDLEAEKNKSFFQKLFS